MFRRTKEKMIKITEFNEKLQKEKLATEDLKAPFEEIDAAEFSQSERVGP